MRAAAGVPDVDELRGRVFALRRSLDDAAEAGKAALVALERPHAASSALDSVESALTEASRRLTACREGDLRSQMLEGAMERMIVHHRVGDGSAKATDAFVELLFMERPRRRVSVSWAARQLFVSRRALGRRLQLAGYPTPGTVLGWGAILRAMHHYAHHHHGGPRGGDLRASALEAGFPDAFSLSNAMERRAGIRPGAWTERADFDELVDRLVETWRAG